MNLPTMLKTLIMGLASVGISLAVLLFVVFTLEARSVAQYIALNDIEQGQTDATDEDHAVNDTGLGLPEIVTLDHVTYGILSSSVSITENSTGTLLTLAQNYTIASASAGQINVISLGNFTLGQEVILVNYTYYSTETAEENCDAQEGSPCENIRAEYENTRDLITLGSGVLGIVVVVAVFMGFLMPMINRS